MANFEDASGRAFTQLVVRTGGITTIALWGGGPSGEKLEVLCRPRFAATVTETKVSNARAHTRYFQVIPLLPGVATIHALLNGADYSEPLKLKIELKAPHLLNREFYHGTTLEAAESLMNVDIGVQSVPAFRLQDDSEFTDFGKGFYVHPPENRKLAIDWAKNHASRTGSKWGVATFVLTDQELDNIMGRRLLFKSKRSDRPANAPKLFDNQSANWIEFVEFNRHVRTGTLRPKDNDWTADYSVMRGPIWVQRDSGLPGKLPPFPDHVHQINLGIVGLAMLNTGEAKARRYVIHEGNQ